MWGEGPVFRETAVVPPSPPTENGVFTQFKSLRQKFQHFQIIDRFYSRLLDIFVLFI